VEPPTVSRQYLRSALADPLQLLCFAQLARKILYGEIVERDLIA
jgi:hypothetical protein